ncbi:GNAT family N-acetyltransferase [Marinomonas sp.]|nr:GNAT family N-acetyltransferase [Marinomonas sp.]MDB4837313.1 GNAT family N-acetyltransferase [Marinomonas sp.]
MSLQIRSATLSDLPTLTEIYNHYIIHTSTTFDIDTYTTQARRVWFDQFSLAGRHQLLVAEQKGQLLGYACSGQLKPKGAYASSVEVSIYLAPDASGRGTGTALYTALFERLSKEDVHRVYACVTQPNEVSRVLHEKFGFKPAGTFREVGRKFDKYWDVAWFEKEM